MNRVNEYSIVRLDLQKILERLKSRLQTIYEKRFVKLILFGSYAREEATAESDIDLLIVLTEEIDVPTENKRISEFLAALCLEYDILITCLWAKEKDWQHRESPLLLNVRREGIAV